MPDVAVLLTCEHGGNSVPPRYRHLFRPYAKMLAGHRGHDIGALECARQLSRYLDVPLFHATTTRLLVDLNRSPHHRAVFSEVTRGLPDAERAAIIGKHYLPYRDRVEQAIAEALGQGLRVMHWSIHSFTPVLDGGRRSAELGLLYDPRRRWEAAICRALKSRLVSLAPPLRVRRNYPYRGTADGFTVYLRRRFPAARYAGIEVEFNQSLTLDRTRRRGAVLALGAAIREMKVLRIT